MLGKRKTAEGYHKLAESKKIKWIGSFPRTSHIKTLWECSKNHRWEASYRDIQRGPGCPVCRTDRRRIPPVEYHMLAEERGFKWLGPEVRNTKIKTRWQCSKNHQWEAPYYSIQQGIGCPFCAGNIQKIPLDYHKLAKNKGLEWLGPEVSNIATKTKWKCERGHQWEARYDDIQRNKSCPYCSGLAHKIADDYLKLAEIRNFKWLGPLPQNVQTKTKWKCLEGHEWQATYSNINHGSGCPHCAKQFPKNPKDYHKLAERRGFKWIGIFPNNTRTKTKWECSNGHQWKARYNSIQQGSGCPHCANQVPKTSVDYHNLAKEQGLDWLGPLPRDTDVKTWWKCQEGHQWETSYGHIRGGKGCPHCYGNAPKTSNDYYELASKRNFKWLGSLPANVNTPTRWECFEGHCWKASYNNVSGGTGCPICAIKIIADKRRTGSDAYHALAKKRGFKWIAKELPTAVLEKTLWECPNGHRWEANYNNIRFGTGCPYCIDMVNGARVSQIQRNLCEIVNGELNYPCLSFNIDVALPDEKIAIEYDSWYWHGGKLEDDRRRDEQLIGMGWRILHIKSNNKLPTQNQLNVAIAQLCSGKSRIEIVLDDWGGGPTFIEGSI